MAFSRRLYTLSFHLRPAGLAISTALAAGLATVAPAAAQGSQDADDGSAALAALGFEYRRTVNGNRSIFHSASNTQITASNWPAFTKNDYNDLGQAATAYIHTLMTRELNLRWLELPGSTGNHVLASPDLETNTDTLLVLIPGSGSVRAGVWGRQLCVTDSLEHGSAVEWAQEALEKGWAVVSFDPNPNNGGDLNGTPCCVRSWQTFVESRSPAKRVVVVAHSAGGA